MSNYNETNILGTKYRRAYQVTMQNGLNKEKYVRFAEEDVLLVEGDAIHQQAGSISEPFTEENSATSIPLLNPEDGSPTGGSITYQEIYVAIYSLYLHLASTRDAEQASE
jgi:hypothetical protein